MPFFLDDKKGGKLKTIKIIEILILDRGGIFIYFRPRDLDFPRVTKLGLLLFSEKGLKKGNIS
jgi:hypothetical protein